MTAFQFAWLVDLIRCLPASAGVTAILGALLWICGSEGYSHYYDEATPGTPAFVSAGTFLLSVALVMFLVSALLPRPETLEKFGADLITSAPQSSPAVSGREAKPK